MKKLIKSSILVLASAMLLTGCGDDIKPSSSDSGASNETSSRGENSEQSSSSDKGNSSSSSTVTTYAIVDRTADGINITLSKTKAAKGETVEITVALESGYVLLGIYANSKECEKVDDTHYTFVMGDAAVAITASLSVTGDVVTSGDIAISLTKQEDGTYKGVFNAESSKSFIVIASGKEYGYGQVDFDRSYADINSVYVSGSKDTTRLRVGGNAKYEITFDLTKERPISLYRTGIFKAPSSADEISSYFCGSYAGRNVLDTGAYNVKGLNHVSYRNSRSAISYTWDLYQDGSLAKATNLLDDTDTSYVYKSVKDNVLTVVDEYIETGKDTEGNYFDRTKTQDTVKFSGKYKLVDEVGNSHYEKTPYLASQEVITPSHELHSMNSEIQYGYYIGYTIEDELKACNRKFTTSTNDDGSFTTSIYAWKNYEDDEAVHTRYQYDTVININADGRLNSVTYKEVYFTESNWSFNDSDTENGGSAITGTSGKTKQSSSVSYGYGDPLSSNTNFDTTPYFISEITDVKVNSRNKNVTEEGHVKYKEVIDEERRDPFTPTVDLDSATGYTSTLSISYLPSTALDVWEYGVVDSEDKSIINLNESKPREWIGCGSGTTNVTIGNHTTNSVTASKSITVDDAPTPNYYLVWAYGDETDNDVPTSSSVVITAGKRMKVYLWASPSDVVAKPIVACSNSDITFSLSEQVKPTVSAISSYPAFILTIDASNITTDTTLSETITVTDSRSDTLSSKISLTVKPGSKSAMPSSIEGTTWTSHNFNNDEDVNSADPRYVDDLNFADATLNFTSTDGKVINGVTYKEGTLTISSSTYKFNYYYGVGDSGNMVFKITDGGNSTSAADVFTIGGTTLDDYGLLGIYAYTSTWGGQDDTTDDYLIGYPEEDDYAASYIWFTMND